MPTITANLNDINALLDRSLNAEELEEHLRLAKAELKEHDAASGEVRIELTDTNRPDLWCAEGVVRQIRTSFSGEPVRYPFFEKRRKPELSVEVDAGLEKVRPFVAAFAARGPAVTDEFLVQIIQTQEKLCENYGRRRRNVAIGIYNAGKIKFPVQYVAAKPSDFTFTPLGCDEAMTLDRIMSEHPKGKEYGPLVRGLDACPILADAEGTVLSFPPIINSRETGEVQVGDDHLFVEATGPDMRQLLVAMNIMAANFADRGWTVEPVATILPYDSEFGRQVSAPCVINEPLAVDVGAFTKAIGETFSPGDIVSGLGRYGVAAAEADAPAGGGSGGSVFLEASCPPWRDDYLHPMDAVEDFAISLGFHSFEPVMPSQFTVGKLKPITLFADRVRSHMTGLGFEEIFSNILSSLEWEREKMGIPGEPIVSIDNVMSETYSVLRSSVLPSLLRVEAGSSKALYPHKLFEAGEVCLPDADDASGARTENRVAALWASADSGFSEIHSVLDMVLYYLVQDYTLRPVDFPFYFEGRAGEIVIADKTVGHIGEVHPAVLTRFGIAMPCAAFEISLDDLCG
jgi:phenylalanyl-tRNA synthetase beta chain